MKFDVIIGNPPYQLKVGVVNKQYAIPIYHKFVRQAKKLAPRYLTMIIPSRWFAGGQGLDEFRSEMLHDRRIRVIHDFINAGHCFSNVKIKGGVNYFLWVRDKQGNCKVYTHDGDNIVSESERPLLESGADTFIRYNQAISVLHKVRALQEESFANIVSVNDPFGIDVREENSYKHIPPKYEKQPFEQSIVFYYYGWQNKGRGYINPVLIRKNKEWVQKFKIFVPESWGIGNISKDWIKPFIGEPNSCCSETYLVIGPFEDEQTAKNVVGYTQTKFFNFLIGLVKISQHSCRKIYSFVPMQDFRKTWTDAELYQKYGLTPAEIGFIEAMVPHTPANGEHEGMQSSQGGAISNDFFPPRPPAARKSKPTRTPTRSTPGCSRSLLHQDRKRLPGGNLPTNCGIDVLPV